MIYGTLKAQGEKSRILEFFGILWNPAESWNLKRSLGILYNPGKVVETFRNL
jgi:hypothetical protein